MLLSSSKDFCLFFIRDQEYLIIPPTVYSQLCSCIKEGIRTKLTNTRKLDYKSANATFNELLSNDWDLVEDQIKTAT